jgi:lipoprotein signal peptidase
LIERLKKPFWSLIIIFIASVAIDQGTKQWAQHTLLDDGFHENTDDYAVCGDRSEDRRRERFIRHHRKNEIVIDGFFRFKYVENCASAFGLMSRVPESFRFPFFLIVSVLAVAFIPYLYRKTPADQRLMIYALPFILGGAIGNLLDRLVFRYVIDFIDWYIKVGNLEKHWPTFNIADAVIVIGIGLMILQMLPLKRFKTTQDPVKAKLGDDVE